MQWVCFSFNNKHVNLPLDAGTVILLCNILQLRESLLDIVTSLCWFRPVSATVFMNESCS